MLESLTVLLVCQLIGEGAVHLLHLPLPGPVLGMLLLLLAFALRPALVGLLQETTQTLLRHLSLLFVPAGVGILAHLARLRSDLLPIVTALLVSTLLTIGVTAFTFVWLERWRQRRGG